MQLIYIRCDVLVIFLSLINLLFWTMSHIYYDYLIFLKEKVGFGEAKETNDQEMVRW